MRRLSPILLFLVMGLACSHQARIDQLEEEKQVLQTKLAKTEDNLAAAETRERIVMERIGFLARSTAGAKARFATTAGKIEVEFYPEKAPLHCFSFITRAESGFYDGTIFHRVIENFMIQGGDPLSRDDNPANDGTGGPVVNIPHEFNDIKHEPGILSMARTSDMSMGAGSQFFIMHATTPQLDNQYTVFGKVISGMDVVNKIAAGKTGSGDRPVSPVKIGRIDVFR